MKRRWSIRAYQKGDENGIFELMESVYPEKKYDRGEWTRWWKWRYMDNPAGFSRIWVADHDGKIVGTRSVILVKMKISGENIMVSQNTDLMTHPDYRRQGIFSAIEKKSFDQLKDEGAYITYSFPSKMSYPRYMKSGSFFDVCVLQTPIKPLNLKNILKKRIGNDFLLKICTIIGMIFINIFYKTKKSPEIEGLTISKITSFDDRVDDFWKKISNDYAIITVRNKEYLNWRYVNVPDVDYIIYLAEKNGEICGYMVLRCMKLQELVVGCIFEVITYLDQEDVTHHLIAKAIEYFEREGVDIIYCKMIVNKIFNEIFGKNGFIPLHFIFKNRFIVRINSPKISETYLKNKENWFIQLGDSDFV